MVQLVYELLDAHADTARLAESPADCSEWEAHLDYLRALRRVGRSLLAQASSHATTANPPLADAAGR
jgi:hypothetical protein